MAKFLAHQLLQNATHRGEAASAFVTGASIAIIIANITIRASAFFMVPTHFCCRRNPSVKYTHR